MRLKRFYHELRVRLKHNWKLLSAVLVPLVFLPLIWVSVDASSVDTDVNPDSKFRTAYVIIVMAFYWTFEIIPLAITAVLPVVLFPLLGVRDAADVTKNYMRESNMIFLGAIIIALAIEYCGLHIRVALQVIRFSGASPTRVMLGVMIISAALSMWIADTSTTTMLIPIVTAITTAMFREEQEEIHLHPHFPAAVIEKDMKKSNNEVYVLSTESMLSDMDRRYRRSSTVFGNVALERVGSRRSRRASVLSIRSLSQGKGSEDTIDSMFSVEEAANERTDHRLPTSHTVVKVPESDSANIRSMSKIDEVETTEIESIQGDTGDHSNKKLPEAHEHHKDHRRHHTHHDHIHGEEIRERLTLQENVRKMLLFSVAYAANIGGTGSLVGTGPIKVFKELYKSHSYLFKHNKLVGATFFTWLGFNLPPISVNILCAWLYLCMRYLGPARFVKGTQIVKDKEQLKQYLNEEYKKLGPFSSQEIGVTCVFVFVLLMWFLRDPQIFPGWKTLQPTTTNGDSTAAMLGVVLLFVIPKDWSFLKCGRYQQAIGAKYETLLDWKFASHNTPFGYLLLIGSGYAVADAANASELTHFIAEKLVLLDSLSRPLLLIIVMLITSVITEFVSSTACAALILPIVFQVSCHLHIHPMYLTMASAVTASFAFMLPISSPPIAIIFATGELCIREMLLNGFILNMICVAVLYTSILTYGEFIFGFSDFPSYAQNITRSNCTLHKW